ncbi:ATP-binding protein, partial [Nocardia sp. NPDC004582]
MLQGREREQHELSRVLTRARAGHGGGMLLWGEPGIGKTALLRDAEQRATEFRVLRRGENSAESGVDFAALRELLGPLADRVPTLPGPQARALAAALGHGPGPADRFLVGAAVVTLLAAAAADQPVLLLVDDAQTLDLATAEALTFALRRLGEVRVALLVALRDCPATTVWQSLRVLPIAPPRRAAARS